MQQYTSTLSDGYPAVTCTPCEGSGRVSVADRVRGNACLYRHISKKPFSPPPVNTASRFIKEARFEIYTRSVKVRRPCPTSAVPPNRAGSSIDSFSAKSRSRLRCLCDNSTHIIKTQFCMTYADVWPDDGKQTKKDLNKFLTSVRYHFDDFKYIWILEFQSRGCPHFHLFSNIPHTYENHKILVRLWHKIAGHNNPDHVKVHSHSRQFKPWNLGTGGYLCKYLDKEKQKEVPAKYADVGRFWGNSRGLIAKPNTIPMAWLDEHFGYEHVNLETGEYIEFVPSKWIIRQLGRCLEHRYKRKYRRYCRFRRYPGTCLTAAPIINRLLDYIIEHSEPPPEVAPF